MNLTALLTELYSRGVAYLNDGGAGVTRATALINQGYHDLCDIEPWPFLEATALGLAPMSISDLGDVLNVTTVNGELPGRDMSVFLEFDPTMTLTGTASYWWLDGESNLQTWPLDTSTTLSVRYRRVPQDLASGVDTPIVPARWHGLIVDFALIRALRDKSNFDEATALRQAIDDDLDRMRESQLDRFDQFQAQTDRYRQ